ncbi:hypothetical protein ACI00D_003967 [Cronobacter dublinensis]
MLFTDKNKDLKQNIMSAYLLSIGQEANSFTLGDGDFIDLQLPQKFIDFKKSKSSKFNVVIVLNKPLDEDEFDSAKINAKFRSEDYGYYIDIKDRVFYVGDESSLQEFIKYLNSCV